MLPLPLVRSLPLGRGASALAGERLSAPGTSR